ncbi:hypothetical protein [Vibrio sp. HA2012]|uniref:hypothetical protein n=1 Tax=Vibrio sp. HA2012 TaxID=1971595 RepID=UPI0018E243E3|nr:hypothetical protein [Vibrio sp. HA2012]
MKINLFQILLNRFGTEANIARAFGLKRAAYLKQRVPENIALLCHLDPTIPYTYHPSHYGKNYEGLSLELTKPEVNDQ